MHHVEKNTYSEGQGQLQVKAFVPKPRVRWLVRLLLRSHSICWSVCLSKAMCDWPSRNLTHMALIKTPFRRPFFPLIDTLISALFFSHDVIKSVLEANRCKDSVRECSILISSSHGCWQISPQGFSRSKMINIYSASTFAKSIKKDS